MIVGTHSYRLMLLLSISLATRAFTEVNLPFGDVSWCIPAETQVVSDAALGIQFEITFGMPLSAEGYENIIAARPASCI